MRRQFRRSRISLGRFVLLVLIVTAGMPAIGNASASTSPVGTRAASMGTATVAPALALPIAWLELGPNGAQIARAIAGAPGCPALDVDGATRPMGVRVPPDPSFPVTVCETAIPAGAASARVAGHALPLQRETPRRVAVIGDTGCRIAGSDVQACDDPARWPFRQIADRIAASRPDLVIHVGDYLYRESPCPAADAACAGSPSGDTWAAWAADFFAPAAALLASAPWVFARGNHEDCQRGGDGWFRLLDPRPFPAACQTYTDPYAATAGDLSLLVLDSAAADDSAMPPEQTAEYARQFAVLDGLASRHPHAWLVTHKPIWGLVEIGNGRFLALGNLTLQAAFDNKVPAQVSLMLAGHIHLAEALGFAPASGRPPVFIAGNGGTELDPAIRRELTGLAVLGARLVTAKAFDQFGYLLLQRSGNLWAGTEHTSDGTILTKCTVQDLRLLCAP